MARKGAGDDERFVIVRDFISNGGVRFVIIGILGVWSEEFGIVVFFPF